jgi:carbonic anhydrase/acetyltransferase-like protein (isoleucine patch superfamily)
LGDDFKASEERLERSLSRISEALDRAAPLPTIATTASPRSMWTATGVLSGLGAMSLALLLGSGNPLFLPLVIGSWLAASYTFGRALFRQARVRLLRHAHSPPQIGAGASVAADAVLEPGSAVGWGASVRSGATIRSGAQVGWGATVGARSVIERGAVVGWGATVRAGAVVGANAVVGWGATVGKGVHIPPGMRLRAGATYSSGWLKELIAAPPPWVNQIFTSGPRQLATPRPRDPAEVRVAAVCDRLEAELRASPEHVRSFLRVSDATVASLRRTCEDLVQREQTLRTEVDPQALARLDEERRQLEARLAAESDERIRRSLMGSVAAIGEQRRQRELLRLSADRLQAERTRLLYTLEGLVAQFVRLRAAGADAGQLPTEELQRSVLALGGEIDAIAEALEQVAHQAPTPVPVDAPRPVPIDAPAPVAQDAPPATGGRSRSGPIR